MTEQPPSPKRRISHGVDLCLVAHAFAAFALLLLVLLSPHRMVYDEGFHLGLAREIQANGWVAGLSSTNNQSAAGPLFSATQLAVASATGLQAPAIRWVNCALVFITLAVVGLTLRLTTDADDWWRGAGLLSVPFLWPAAGMALTELPALLAFSVHVLCMLLLLDRRFSLSGLAAVTLCLVAGLSLGLSVLGRQTYLVILPVLVALFVFSPRQWAFWIFQAGCVAGSAAWLFALWGGMVPPHMGHVGTGFRFDCLLLSFSYVAAATLFLNPQWLLVRSKVALIVLVAFGFLFAFVVRDYSSPPAKSLLVRLLGEPLGLMAGFGLGALMIGMGLIWIYRAVTEAWAERGNLPRLYLHLSVLALAFAPAKVSHLFSSRYVVGLLGVLLLVVGPPARSTFPNFLRLLAGSVIGAAVLWTYYR